MMRYLIIILKDYTYPYLDRALADVRMSGTELVPFCVTADDILPLDEAKAKKALDASEREHIYLLTDCPQGIRFSRQYDIGYVYCDISAISDCDTVNSEADKTDADDGIYGINDTAGPQCVIQGFDEITADFMIKMYQRYHHLPWTILNTGRLTLREMTVDDVDRLYEIYAGDGITDYTEPLYEDRQQEIEYTRDYIKNMYEFCGYGLWLVIEKDSGRIVGRAGITGREGYDEAELGYVIERERQRRGYALEACRAIIGYARDKLEMKGVNCFVQPGNEASVKLCKLLGFEYLETVKLSDSDFMRYHLTF